MTPAERERLTRLEALFEMDAASSTKLEKRLDKFEESVGESLKEVSTAVTDMASDMKTAKSVGRIAIGAAAAFGGLLTTAIHLFVNWKKVS